MLIEQMVRDSQTRITKLTESVQHRRGRARCGSPPCVPSVDLPLPIHHRPGLFAAVSADELLTRKQKTRSDLSGPSL